MHKTLEEIKRQVYDKIGLKISDFSVEVESKGYGACRFALNGQRIVSRNSKVTPKKAGQFVTFWQRNEKGIIEPFHETDSFDFFVVNVRAEGEFGQFVFPKSVLVKHGIISTIKKEGKRAFRIYPSWCAVTNKQADRAQQWQAVYFYNITHATDFDKVLSLFKTELQ